MPPTGAVPAAASLPGEDGTDASALALAKERGTQGQEGTSLTDVGRDIHADDFAPEVVVRSKDIVASAAEELQDHQRWLKDFVASEERSRKRHARALKREQARCRREIKRERTALAITRAALSFMLSFRSKVKSLSRGLVATTASARGAIVFGSAWVSPKAYALAISVLDACADKLSWLRVKAPISALFASKPALLAASWIAARTREASMAAPLAAAAAIVWTVAAADEAARRSRAAARIGATWPRSRIRARDAVLRASSWSAVMAVMVTRASLAASFNAATWTRARAGGFAQTVQRVSFTASPRIRATAEAVSARLLQLSVEAKEIAERKSEDAAFLAMRLNAQAKGEIDALKRAVREGRLTPQWRKVASAAFFRTGAVSVHEVGEGHVVPAGASAPETDDRVSGNAVLLVEPWRCRLPVVRSDGFVDQVLMGAVRRAPTEARRSS